MTYRTQWAQQWMSASQASEETEMKLSASGREEFEILRQGETAGEPAQGMHGKGWAFVAPLRRFLGARSEGGALVEFALVVPMMLLLMTGMFSIGIALNNYTVLTNGVSTGARAFALARGQSGVTDPCAYAAQITQQAAASLKSSSLTYSMAWTTTNSAGATVTTNYTNTCSGIALNAGDTIQVQATYPVPMIVYGWAPGTIHITGQSFEMVQ
jgi:Flp pilus assembly protein TadG